MGGETSMSGNPYEAPRAAVADVVVAQGAEALRREPRRVAAGRGWNWIAAAWELLSLNPGAWVVLMLVVMALGIALQFLPIVGGIVQQAITPFSGAAVALLADSLRRGGAGGISEVIDGVVARFGGLALLAGIYIGATLCLILVVGVPAVLLGMSGVLKGDLIVVLVVLLVLALLLPLIMATYFAPALVALHDTPPLQALRLSFRACLVNFVPFLVFGLCLLGLAVVATLPLFLGWLVLFPAMLIACYTSYRDIFFDE